MTYEFTKELTQEVLNNIATYMDTETRERCHGYNNTPAEFLNDYLDLEPSFIKLIKAEFRFILK